MEQQPLLLTGRVINDPSSFHTLSHYLTRELEKNLFVIFRFVTYGQVLEQIRISLTPRDRSALLGVNLCTLHSFLCFLFVHVIRD